MSLETVVVLAAGEGTRMKSSIPKVQVAHFLDMFFTQLMD
jgi:bifunctional N-acetylglucosamine-1-phosphate-uridyltransferase/glucosamine-1-phosphate-acetyltransferase GlmU-like protein